MHKTTCWAAQDNLIRHISHIRLQFRLRAISLRLSTNNGPHRENPVCHVILASTPAEKWKLLRCMVYFLLQIQFTGRYDHQSKSDFVFLLYWKCRNQSYLKCDSRICPREAHATLLKPGHTCHSPVSCQAATWFGWFQHRIHHVLPYAVCDLTVLLHDYKNLMLLVVICCWCDVDVCRDPGNVSTSIIAQHTVWEL